MKLQFAKFFASVIFIGKFPVAPGTFASLMANLFLYFILLYQNQASIDLRSSMVFLVPFLFFVVNATGIFFELESMVVSHVMPSAFLSCFACFGLLLVCVSVLVKFWETHAHGLPWSPQI